MRELTIWFYIWVCASLSGAWRPICDDQFRLCHVTYITMSPASQRAATNWRILGCYVVNEYYNHLYRQQQRQYKLIYFCEAGFEVLGR
jgi:hypothetical protein